MDLWLYLVETAGRERSQQNLLEARATGRMANPSSGFGKKRGCLKCSSAEVDRFSVPHERGSAHPWEGLLLWEAH